MVTGCKYLILYNENKLRFRDFIKVPLSNITLRLLKVLWVKLFVKLIVISPNWLEYNFLKNAKNPRIKNFWYKKLIKFKACNELRELNLEYEVNFTNVYNNFVFIEITKLLYLWVFAKNGVLKKFCTTKLIIITFQTLSYKVLHNSNTRFYYNVINLFLRINRSINPNIKFIIRLVEDTAKSSTVIR